MVLELWQLRSQKDRDFPSQTNFLSIIVLTWLLLALLIYWLDLYINQVKFPIQVNVLLYYYYIIVQLSLFVAKQLSKHIFIGEPLYAS